MNAKELNIFLNEKASEYNNISFIESDPILLCHRFSKKEDIEIIGLLIATIAWGNRKSILNSGEKLIQIMNHSPHEFILNYKSSPDLHFIHRTFNTSDLDFFFRALKNVYSKGGSIEQLFQLKQGQEATVKNRIVNFRQEILKTEHESRVTKHISNPLKNSAAKRLNMYLRWMVRSDENGVDFGIWNSIPMSELMIPLDVHTSRNARKLGLITRKQDDWKTLEELMVELRKFDSKDPSKYDFALFGIGVFEK